MPPAVYAATGARQDLLTRVERQPTDPVARAVALGERQRRAARLLAVRVPHDGAETRRRRVRQAARDKGRHVRATRLALAAGPLCVTKGSAERLTLREAWVLGRMRGQMELRCKVGKRQGNVDAARRTQPWRLLCEGSATLLALLVQPGLFLVSFWASPDRSRTKAAQTVQPHALPLAIALARVQRLGRALSIVPHGLTVGWRRHRRQKPPHTYQL